MKLKLNISPCPNDTFMFDAIINHRIDCRGFEFDVTFADIEELNNMVCNSKDGRCVDISKISYAILPQISGRYNLLDSGSAMGRGNGPIFVSKHDTLPDYPKVAIPGEHTTANLLLKRLYPHIVDKTPILFSEIADAVINGEYDAGVLIHEGRFTYETKGLKLVSDLGIEWESRERVALPLGAIVIDNTLTKDVQQSIETLLRESVEYAMANPTVSRSFIKQHAQEMEESVIDSHISLFVNDYSISLGEEGHKAIKALLSVDCDHAAPPA